MSNKKRRYAYHEFISHKKNISVSKRNLSNDFHKKKKKSLNRFIDRMIIQIIQFKINISYFKSNLNINIEITILFDEFKHLHKKDLFSTFLI